MSYRTKQRDLIINVIKSQRQAFTIKDIYREVKDNTGLTTIYRIVDKMVKDNELRKYLGKDNITYYEYLEKCMEDNHFYLKCNSCGHIIHIDCDCIKYLSNHICDEHHFKINKEGIVINGLCQKCVKKNGEDMYEKNN